VTTLPPQAGAARLAGAYPVNGVYLTLTLDRHDRPVSEVEATPNHLITRTFRYPTG
jgi:copper transport protein